MESPSIGFGLQGGLVLGLVMSLWWILGRQRSERWTFLRSLALSTSLERCGEVSGIPLIPPLAQLQWQGSTKEAKHTFLWVVGVCEYTGIPDRVTS